MQAMPDAPALGFAQRVNHRVNQRMSEASVGDFQRDGAIVIRQFLTSDELATLREGINAPPGRMPSYSVLAACVLRLGE